MANTITAASKRMNQSMALKKDWSLTGGNRKVNKYKSNKTTDSDFYAMKQLVDTMRNTSNYKEYLKAFNSFCKLCFIQPQGCVIKNYKLVKGNAPDRNTVEVTYVNTKQRITIPKGYTLYHISPVRGIKELNPTFRTKSDNSKGAGYLYSSKRVYFTIRKDMPTSFADLGRNGTKYYYTPVENIRTAFIDPLVPDFSAGAIYVETNYPIKVKSIKPEKTLNPIKAIADNIAPDIKESTEEDINVNSLEEFVESIGGFFVDEVDASNYDYYAYESIAAIKGAIDRKIKDDKALEDIYKEKSYKSRKSSRTVKLKDFSKEDYDKLMDDYEKMSNIEIYSQYKKYFNKVCKWFDLPTDIIIEHVYKDKSSTDNKIIAGIRYGAESRQGILVPKGSLLIHSSPLKGIKELSPTFRSKTKGAFFYPTSRVYFTLDKNISKFKYGVKGKVYKYTPNKDYSVCYVDPSYPSYKDRAVYIDSIAPIKVTPVENKLAYMIKNNLKKESYDELYDDSYEIIDESALVATGIGLSVAAILSILKSKNGSKLDDKILKEVKHSIDKYADDNDLIPYSNLKFELLDYNSIRKLINTGKIDDSVLSNILALNGDNNLDYYRDHENEMKDIINSIHPGCIKDINGTILYIYIIKDNKVILSQVNPRNGITNEYAKMAVSLHAGIVTDEIKKIARISKKNGAKEIIKEAYSDKDIEAMKNKINSLYENGQLDEECFNDCVDLFEFGDDIDTVYEGFFDKFKKKESKSMNNQTLNSTVKKYSDEELKILDNLKKDIIRFANEKFKLYIKDPEYRKDVLDYMNKCNLEEADLPNNLRFEIFDDRDPDFITLQIMDPSAGYVEQDINIALLGLFKAIGNDIATNQNFSKIAKIKSKDYGDGDEGCFSVDIELKGNE